MKCKYISQPSSILKSCREVNAPLGLGIMAQESLSKDAGKQTETLAQLRCVAGKNDNIHKQLILIATINIFLCSMAFLGNTLILVALRKESSLHPPSKLLYRCLATTDLCIALISEPSSVAYWLSFVSRDWKLCKFGLSAYFIASHTICSVSILTMTAISVDRLLALVLGLRYRQIVTLKRTYVVIAIFWILSVAAGAAYFVDYRISVSYGYTLIPLCLITATFSYTKIFHRLHRSRNQVQILISQQPSQPVSLNMALYRNAVYSALWVQVAFVCCSLPYSIVAVVVPYDRLSPYDFILLSCAESMFYLNSSLNPLLYCWKINEVRRAVKETLRQTFRCISV